ncbi:OsmC family protein [Bdellovibrio sp. 22V]|uniref:OsmC family protein n=1 Tax=Bdellovibrio sp. 22V TaxID=3044166 RepID=UPI002542FE8D|nr:OsmC family protein [Bdellovibrio sp. 22V]WII71181.1 OsmC family protein [Bdellovibrio sp. 22V]
MSHMECKTKWLGGLGFEAQIRQHSFVMDSRGENGKDQGPSPKEVLLASICVCSGMDVASILQKMRVDLISCEVNAQTDTTAGYPSIFEKVMLQYRIDGSDIKAEQALKAVRLSMTKYCGVSAMVVKASPMFYEVFLNGNPIGQGQADFSGNAE